MDHCAHSYYYQKGEIAMKKKNMVLACGAAVALALGSPQMTGVGFAKPFPVYNIGDVVEKNGYVVMEPLFNHPEQGGAIYGYRVIDPKSIKIIEKNDKKYVYFRSYFLFDKKLENKGTWWAEIDLYNSMYRDEYKYDWIDTVHDVEYCPVDKISECWNYDFKNFALAVINYVKTNNPDIYKDVMESGRLAEEKEIAAERERLEKQLTTATDFAQNTPYVFADYGKQIDWAEFTQDPVDYTKTPQLSELIGHVFQLSDTHGFQAFTKDDNKTPYLKIDRRRSALVHFTILPRDKDSYQIALMDDTGDFVGKENINKKPLIRDFKAYHAEYGFYRGLTNEVFHKTGSFNSFGSVIGQSNLVDGFFNGGIVSVGIEKTDEAGKYKLVYYMTSDHRDNYGATSTTTVKYDGVYATLTLVK